ncbi:MAG: PCMD domain-containing protein [Fibrobacter sp.]|nr:PCMD domain-containing protein [Fibrobacter sp.]
MQRKSFKKLMVGGALLASLGFVAGCGDEGTTAKPIDSESVELFESAEFSVDVKNHEVSLPGAVDSLVVGSLDVLGGAKYFVATDDDPVDPSFDWDEELVPGSVIKFADTNSVRIVVLDDENRTIAVWTISYPVDEKSSSSAKEDSSSSKEDDEVSSSSEEAVESSSSEEVVESSSSEEIIESSSSETVDESSSSVEPVEESSSSEIIPSSSSEETVESSSSEEIVESSSSEEVVESSSSEEVVVSSSSEEPVVESSSSEPVVSSSSEEPVVSSSSEMPVVESSSSTEEVVVEGPQLPGTHFDSWDRSFWGSTSDAMAKDEWNAAIHLYSGANLKENGSSITLTSQVVYGSAVGQKLAGGFYFTGEYTGTTCDDIYNADGGYPGLESSNLTKKMNFGRPFTARPKSFDVTYAYDHVAGKDKSHPQMDLIYVMLVSADNKVIASGMITDTESVALTTKRVELQYGYAPKNLIDGTFAVQSGLTLGDGTEEVATIHVMFASSAHAHVAANGSSNWRGGKGSQLTIDEFKLNY